MPIETEIDDAGKIIMIEPVTKKSKKPRVFRSTADGYEWTCLSDYRRDGSRTRFYRWNAKELPRTMTA